MGKSYKKPNKLNAVSFLVLIVLAALIYSAVQFSPPYYRKWKTKEILSETANQVFPRRFMAAEDARPFLDALSEETAEKLRNLGIDDPDLKVVVNKDDYEITVEADYVERIKHPLIGKATVLRFRPFNSLDIRRGE